MLSSIPRKCMYMYWRRLAVTFKRQHWNWQAEAKCCTISEYGFHDVSYVVMSWHKESSLDSIWHKPSLYQHFWTVCICIIRIYLNTQKTVTKCRRFEPTDVYSYSWKVTCARNLPPHTKLMRHLWLVVIQKWTSCHDISSYRDIKSHDIWYII